MIRFECDYCETAHPKILEAVMNSASEQNPGYSEDIHCENARNIIKKLCRNDDLAVHFMVGGTQTNTTVIAALLRTHQGVIAANTGHINVHETGAIEAVGHKVLSVPTPDGKLTAEQIQSVYDAHKNDVNYEHMVQPGMVYISHPTENGTMYSKAELTAISEVCRKCGLPLFLDGARLGYGIMSERSGLELPDFARLCDVFYIGGTKIGAMFGEAVVISNEALKKDFRYIIKQRGGMLAKGWLLGIQFETLLKDGLYFEISKHADAMAMKIKKAFVDAGCRLLFDSYTNQQYPILPDMWLKELSKKYVCSFWEKTDESHTAVRFCTSWGTSEEHVDELVRDIKAISKLI